MKTFILILGTIVLISFANAIVGDVVIKEAPLKYHEVVTTDGGKLFNNVCAVCHGTGGRGDGPAAPGLTKPVADLTILSAINDGVYPYEYVEDAITGRSRVVVHGTIDMPVWGEQLMALRPDWISIRRTQFTRKRIRSLNAHIETLQAQ